MDLHRADLAEPIQKIPLERFPASTPELGWITPLLEEAAAVRQSVV